MPESSNRYVDDTPSAVVKMDEAHNFHNTLNNAYLFLSFIMEVQNENGQLLFLGTMMKREGSLNTTSVYRKPTNTGPVLHYQSHVDNR